MMGSDHKKQRKLIVCITGMPGAGKSTIAESLRKKGFYVISMGDVIREEARQRNLDPTDNNLGKLMLKLRDDLGPGAITHLKQRARSDDPSAVEEFASRDKRELTVGISEAIALADETLSNNDLTVDQLKEKAFKTIKKWIGSTHK